MEGYTDALDMISEAASFKLKLQTVALNMALNMGLTAASFSGNLGDWYCV